MSKWKLILVALLAMACLVYLAGCVPKPPPPPVSQLEEMRGKIVLLTLNPKPSKVQMEDLGFNGLMPYAGTVDGWTGDYISIPVSRPGPVILRFTADEPDCRQYDPQEQLERLKQMKEEAPGIPVGFVLCQDLGCGFGDKEEWIEVARQADFVSAGVYTFHERWTEPESIDDDAMARLKLTADTIEEELNGTPFIPMLQAHWGLVEHDGKRLLKPNVELQVKFWIERGYHGFIVYCWNDGYNGVQGTQAEWKTWIAWVLENYDKVGD